MGEMEGNDDGERDDGEVHGQTEPGEKGALIGAVVAGIGGLVLEEEGAAVGAGEENVGLVFGVPGEEVREHSWRVWGRDMWYEGIAILIYTGPKEIAIEIEASIR